MTLEIVTGETTSSISSVKADPTDFRITSEEGESATLDIYQGIAEVTSAGTTIEVPANHSVTIRPGEPPSVPVPLPGAPEPEAPKDGEVRSYSTIRPEVGFQWGAAWDADGWQLQISRDPRFEDLVHDGTLDSPELIHGQLPDGMLYWRVRATKQASRGPFSETREITIAADSEPPSLQVELSVDPQSANQLIVRGTTEPGTDVFVATQQVRVDEQGTF